MTHIRLVLFATLVMLCAQACGSDADADTDTDSGAPDAGPDTAPDTGTDVPTVPSGDAASDTGGTDVAAGDATTEVAADAGGGDVVVIQPTCTMATAKAYEPFDGTALAAHWNQTGVGMAPTFAVSGGRLQITDAALATTPSMPGNSWLYDSDVDLGNQMTWAQPIGSGDFELLFEAGSASSLAQLTMAGIALTDAAGHMEAFAAVWDGDASFADTFGAFVRKPGVPDASAGLKPANIAKAAILIRRQAGQITVAVDGKVALTEANGADIQKLAIVTVRHKNAVTDFEFGTAELDELTLCY